MEQRNFENIVGGKGKMLVTIIIIVSYTYNVFYTLKYKFNCQSHIQALPAIAFSF